MRNCFAIKNARTGRYEPKYETRAHLTATGFKLPGYSEPIPFSYTFSTMEQCRRFCQHENERGSRP